MVPNPTFWKILLKEKLEAVFNFCFRVSSLKMCHFQLHHLVALYIKGQWNWHLTKTLYCTGFRITSCLLFSDSTAPRAHSDDIWTVSIWQHHSGKPFKMFRTYCVSTSLVKPTSGWVRKLFYFSLGVVQGNIWGNIMIDKLTFPFNDS